MPMPPTKVPALVFTGDEWTRCDACRGSGLGGDGCRCHGGSACAVCDGRGEVRKSRMVVGRDAL